MLRKEMLEVPPIEADDTVTPYVLEVYRDKAWRPFRGLWHCANDADARTRAVSILDTLTEEAFQSYSGWRVIRVTHYAPEVDA